MSAIRKTSWRAPRDFESRFRHFVVATTCLLAFADALTTSIGVQMGLFREANPFMALFLVNGLVGFAIAKGTLTAFWAVISWVAQRRWLTVINTGVMIGYTLVVLRSSVHLLQEVQV